MGCAVSGERQETGKKVKRGERRKEDKDGTAHKNTLV